MIRYYLAPIVQNFRGAYISKVQQYMIDGMSVSSKMLNAVNWCLSSVDTEPDQHAVIAGDNQIVMVPLWDSGGNYLSMQDLVSVVAPQYQSQITNYLGRSTDWVV